MWHEKCQFIKDGSGDPRCTCCEGGGVAGGEGGEMGDFETKKLWALVAKGIREGDFKTASKEKSRIEVCSISYWLVT